MTTSGGVCGGKSLLYEFHEEEESTEIWSIRYPILGINAANAKTGGCPGGGGF